MSRRLFQLENLPQRDPNGLFDSPDITKVMLMHFELLKTNFEGNFKIRLGGRLLQNIVPLSSSKEKASLLTFFARRLVSE